MIQAMSGLMSITGFEANGPTRVGFAGADVMSGATAAFGVASALYQRTHTGKGQLVDVAMIDAVMGYLAQQFTEHLMTGRVHGQAANLSVTRKPTGDLYKTKDGWMVLAVMTEPQFQRLMKVVGRADALADPRFADSNTSIYWFGWSCCEGRPNSDHRMNPVEGIPAYGPVRVSLTKHGDTSPKSALAVNRFPTGRTARSTTTATSRSGRSWPTPPRTARPSW